MPHYLPTNRMEFWYLLMKECITPVMTSGCTLGIVFIIADNVDTEWWAVGGAGFASLLGQVIHKKIRED